MSPAAQASGQGLDRTGTKYQHRHKQGQHQQGEQDTAATQTQGEGCANGSNTRQHGGTDQEGQGQHAQGIARQVKQDPQQGRQ